MDRYEYSMGPAFMSLSDMNAKGREGWRLVNVGMYNTIWERRLPDAGKAAVVPPTTPPQAGRAVKDVPQA